jgi:hypothetical protein
VAVWGLETEDYMSKKVVPNDTNNKPKKAKEFKWSAKSKKVAILIAEGFGTQTEISTEVGVHESTISKWKREPEFLEKVDELTLAYEKASKAGLLREAYKGLNIKSKNISNDKSSHLDYVKAIADIQGHSKQTILHEGAPVNVLFYLPDNNRDIKIVSDVGDDGTTDNSN